MTSDGAKAYIECQGTWKDTFRTLGELNAQVLRCNECGDIWAIWTRQKRQYAQVFPKGTTDREMIDFILKGGEGAERP